MIDIVLYRSRSGWDWLQDAIREYNDCFMSNVALENIYRTAYNKKDSIFIGDLQKSKSILKYHHDVDYSFHPFPFMNEKWIYNRDITKQNIEDLNTDHCVFVKPIEPKLFPTQRVFGSIVKGYQSQGNVDSGECFVSDVVPNIKSEWRFYVGESECNYLLEYRHAANYVGNPAYLPDGEFMK